MKDLAALKLLTINQSQVAAFARQELVIFWQDIQKRSESEKWQKIQSFLTHSRIETLNRALLFSLFMRKIFLSDPDRLLMFLQMPTLDKHIEQSEFVLELTDREIADELHLDVMLRSFRQLHMLRFVYRHFNGLCTTREMVMELSDFADACIGCALKWHSQKLIERFGMPVGEDTNEQQIMVILAMGKLGAGELNLSSDIDLIFSYPEAGFTQGKEVISNQEFFSALGRCLIKTLNQKTSDGFVFRVDMRLRPLGQSGPLVNSFPAMEHYYQYQGREWERYAMIKARALPESPAAMGLEYLLNPFVYRRYTDFSAIEALREMKRLINKEVHRLGKHQDIKLSAGGIREIEFIAQVYQLIYGGKQPQLQQRNLVDVLQTLQNLKIMPEKMVSELILAYQFLRDTEHCLQGVDDRQTHRLPRDESAQKLLALAMRFDDWPSFIETLSDHCQKVRHYFDGLIEDRKTNQSQNLSLPIENSASEGEDFIEWLSINGFSKDEIDKLLYFKKSPKILALSSDVRHRVKRCLQGLLPLLAEKKERGVAVSAVINLLESILRRSVYLVLLNENPDAMVRLVTIACASPWVMNQLTLHPSLLDELLETKPFGHISRLDDMADHLQQHALRIPLDDLEEQMDLLRYFKMAIQAQIVLAEVGGELPLFRVSDYLSHLAEAILSYTLGLAWHHTVEKYGYPTDDGKPCEEPPFAIVAYGKLGGIELSYNSDLDLVFLYDAPLQAMTDGERPIENSVFFMRLGQRIIHILSTRTQLGQLYDVDVRLRPSGNKGLLVSSLKAFENYQHKEAWIWEQQALVRARVVAGSPVIRNGFTALRENILAKKRPIKTLASEVISMREKMFTHLAPAYAKSEDAEIFHIKHSRWGIVDIEFMVQFAVLAFAHTFTELVTFTDNIRILEIMADKGLISDQERRDLVEAYQTYRSLCHNLALKQEKNEVSACQLQHQRQVVKKAWQKLILSPDRK